MIAVKVDGIFLLSLKHPKRRVAEYMVEGGEGEIIPVNPTPYLLSPALLAAIAIIALILAASLTVEMIPNKNRDNKTIKKKKKISEQGNSGTSFFYNIRDEGIFANTGEAKAARTSFKKIPPPHRRVRMG